MGRCSMSWPITRMSQVTSHSILRYSSRSRTRHSMAFTSICTASFSWPQAPRSIRRTTASLVHSANSGKPTVSFSASCASTVPPARRASQVRRAVRATLSTVASLKTSEPRRSSRPMHSAHSKQEPASSGNFIRDCCSCWESRSSVRVRSRRFRNSWKIPNLGSLSPPSAPGPQRIRLNQSSNGRGRCFGHAGDKAWSSSGSIQSKNKQSSALGVVGGPWGLPAASAHGCSPSPSRWQQQVAVAPMARFGQPAAVTAQKNGRA
mmetsp:Transcript_27315/g.63624  ORF Transcript_27315/g.63624 Transcript_27315/m.63624 type:complete len:263 (+) Transcript_27315:654-1442(+)